MVTVKVGQVWEHTSTGRFRRVRVIEIIGETDYATVMNVDSEKISRIALAHFCPHHHWRLHAQPRATKPVAATGVML